MKNMEKKIIRILCIGLVLAMLGINLNCITNNVSATWYTSYVGSPGTQGEDCTFRIIVHNNEEGDMLLKWVGVHFDWQAEGEYYYKTLSLNIPKGEESGWIDITFHQYFRMW